MFVAFSPLVPLVSSVSSILLAGRHPAKRPRIVENIPEYSRRFLKVREIGRESGGIGGCGIIRGRGDVSPPSSLPFITFSFILFAFVLAAP